MRRYSPDEEVDFCIVGVGSAGGVLLQRLARAGFSVVGLEAGPFWDTERDWVSDETGSHKLYWNDLRITGGENPLAFGANNSGKGVGGGSVHWAAFTPRFHPSDFRSLHATTASAPTGRFPTGTSNRTTSCWSGRSLSPARRTSRGAIRMAIPTGRIRWAASATC